MIPTLCRHGSSMFGKFSFDCCRQALEVALRHSLVASFEAGSCTGRTNMAARAHQHSQHQQCWCSRYPVRVAEVKKVTIGDAKNDIQTVVVAKGIAPRTSRSTLTRSKSVKQRWGSSRREIIDKTKPHRHS